MSSGGVRARAASWTRKYPASGASASPARTESVRSAPPTTTRTASEGGSRATARSVKSAGTITTTRSTTPEASRPSTASRTMGVPPTGTNALGVSSPRRTPRPAAGTRATTRPSLSMVFTIRSSASGRRGEDLVEQGLGLAVVGALRERELADENLPRLGEHALLTSGKSAILLAAPQIAHDLGHLVHIAGGELLQVGLVATGPVGRLLGVRCP